MSVEVYLERGKKKVFASAYDWPGWSRGAADDEAALEALATYADRYSAVVEPAGFSLPPATFTVVEQVTGGSATDFGVPHEVTDRDRTRITAAKAGRLADLVAACWDALDRGAAVAPAALRKGPRGGGRDRDAVVQHVREAERAYAAKLGVRIGPREYGDVAAVAVGRERILEVLRAGGAPPEKGWPIRYGARRIGWHVLDHLWEIEDKSH